MNTKYTIKNFRVFDEKGVTVDLKPITILTGCNSSGKSSIVKSMVLLDTYIQSLLDDYKVFGGFVLNQYKLDFTKDITSSLGNFKRVIHEGSKKNTLTFQYQVHSLLLGEDVLVSFTFGMDKNDLINQGYLRSINISTISGNNIYYSAENEPLKANYNFILHNFFRFAYGELLADFQNKYKEKCFHLYGSQTEEEFHRTMSCIYGDERKRLEDEERVLKDFKVASENFEKFFISSYGQESLSGINKWNAHKGYVVEPLINNYANGHIEILDISLKWHTLFYFPLLEKLYDVDSHSFKDTLLDMIKGIAKEEEVLIAINKITDDLKASGEKTFGEYFKNKETSFLNFTYNWKKGGHPDIYTGFFDIYGAVAENVFCDDSYLQWTRRLLGPEFYTTDSGNYVSTIGPGEIDDWKNFPVNFSLVYDVLLNIDHLLDDSENIFYTIRNDYPKKIYHGFEHRLFKMFTKYASMFLKEVVTSALPHNLSYIGTSLVNVKRDYPLDTNDAFSVLIKKYLEAKRKNSKSNKNSTEDNSFINRWLKKLGIGHSVQILLNPSGSSYTIRLFKNAGDSVGTILAEEGYGVTQLITLLIRVEIAILEAVKRGVSDPYGEDEDVYEYVESTIAIEEPEVHLHPKLQSLLAEMFVDAYKNYNVHFIIETHSEYLIRKLQTIVAKKEILNSDISIIYVYDKLNRPDCDPQVKNIGISEKGMLLGRFGEGFFDEADELSMSLLMQQRVK